MTVIFPGSALLCAECGHSVDLSRAKIGGLVRKHFPLRSGETLLESDLKSFKCSKCGHKEPLLVLPPSREDEGHSCPQCNGDGGISNNCPTCGGTGWIQTSNVLYDMNPDEDDLNDSYQLPARILPHLRATRAWALRSARVVHAYVFGSRMRGTEHEGSDIDVAIELLKSDDEDVITTWILDAESLQADLQRYLPMKVHLELYASQQITPKVHNILARGYIQIK
jgi:predicted nucleotidyltransferase